MKDGGTCLLLYGGIDGMVDIDGCDPSPVGQALSVRVRHITQKIPSKVLR